MEPNGFLRPGLESQVSKVNSPGPFILAEDEVRLQGPQPYSGVVGDHSPIAIVPCWNRGTHRLYLDATHLRSVNRIPSHPTKSSVSLDTWATADWRLTIRLSRSYDFYC